MKTFLSNFALFSILGLGTASASLILQSPVQISGTGLGTVPTILTIQNDPSEIGCVGFAGTGSTYNASGVCTGSNSDVKTGASQTLLEPLSAASIISASNFALVFNANQPAAGPITLTGLQAAFYSPTGTFLYETSGLSCAGLASSPGCTFPSTFNGTGNSGFVFILDSAQQAAATTAGVFANPANLIGVSFSASNSSGGPETVFLASTSTTTSSIPEPGALLIVASGFALVGVRFVRMGKSSRQTHELSPRPLLVRHRVQRAIRP